MLGLIIAALVFTYYLLFGSTPEANTVAAAEPALSFLITWHWVMFVLKSITLGFVSIVGFFVGASGKTHSEKVSGAAMFFGGPILFLLSCILTALYLGGVYVVDSGISNGTIISESHVIAGAVIYFVGILAQLSCRVHSKGKE